MRKNACDKDKCTLISKMFELYHQWHYVYQFDQPCAHFHFGDAFFHLDVKRRYFCWNHEHPLLPNHLITNCCSQQLFLHLLLHHNCYYLRHDDDVSFSDISFSACSLLFQIDMFLPFPFVQSYYFGTQHLIQVLLLLKFNNRMPVCYYYQNCCEGSTLCQLSQTGHLGAKMACLHQVPLLS